MAFASLVFLFGFLPLAWGSYLLLPPRMRRWLLPILSFLFYVWGEPWGWLLLLSMATIAYLSARRIFRLRLAEKRRGRALTAVTVLLLLLPLLFFKSIGVASAFALPLGLSFYTFSLLSYVIDVSRGDFVAESNYLTFLGYASFFPSLTAGPIVRYGDVKDAWMYPASRWEGVGNGIFRFLLGLSKKLIIGDALAGAYSRFYDMTTTAPTVFGAWMTAILYSLHLYYDFSGYTDMALGLGRMFGIRLPENFDYPFTAATVGDFWRRWHMSLTNWFRRYVYIPLGGNRRGTLSTYRNLAIVWILTGIWHGSGINYLLWGVYFGLLLIAERALLRRLLSHAPVWISHLYTLIAVIVGFLLFSTREIAMLPRLFSALVGIGTTGFFGIYEGYRFLHLMPLLFLAILAATPLLSGAFRRMTERHPAFEFFKIPISILLFLLCLAYLNDAAFLPFEYAKF